MASLNILANRILDWCEKSPDLDVLTFVSIGDKGEILDDVRSYQQLWDNGQRLAKWLRGQGIGKGDSFAIVMANHAEFVELMVASSILGSIFVPIDPRTKGDKLQYMLEFAECKGVIAAEYALDNVIRASKEKPERWILPLSGQASSVQNILAGPKVAPELTVASTDEDEPMQLLFTSGTTGDPKAILTAHSRFGATLAIADILGLTDQDRPYTGLSLTHANAQIITLGCTLALGLRGVISRKFKKSNLWQIARKYGCTWFNLLGGMTTAVYSEPANIDDADNPVRIILSAGMPEMLWENFEQRFSVTICEFYGAAEGGLTINPVGVGPRGSCGKPTPNLKLTILNEDDEECAIGDAGEICFQNSDGSVPLIKYFKNPSASQEKMQGGYLRMGDIGHVDDQGWLFFHHRMGGGIRRNGDFINTGFVEKALGKIDGVDDVYVYGVPLKGMAPGEKEVVAAIVKNSEYELSVSDIFTTCKESLDKGAMPGYLQFVDEIPKTASEKPQERFLLESFDVHAANVYAN